MTTGLGWTATQLATFDELCRLVTRRGHGITLLQLGDAGALARALDQEDVDRGLVEQLAARLGLEAGEMEALP
ncbi:MAG TPA: hypothetical protein VE173_05030 [Longimicrobiales bacterium]|nr:hypothetical protein [Longimicrobiales bacterium]